MKDAIENYVIVKSKCYGYFKNDIKDYVLYVSQSTAKCCVILTPYALAIV